MSEWLDKDGYPTEDALMRITKWEVIDPIGCLDFVKDLWSYPDRVRDEVRPLPYDDTRTETVRCFSTGGWSGNESLIGAMKQNFGLRIVWVMSKRGGYHEYVLKEYA